MQRIRWRCRRGLLELDIVLGRFVERHYAALDEAGRAALDALLDMPDTELWDMITERDGITGRAGIAGRDNADAPLAECNAVLKLIRAS